MTGENFKRLNRNRDKRLEDNLLNAKVEFTNYAKRAGDADFSFDILNALECKVGKLEYLVWCKNYNA